jgi:hypothetical protein
MRVYLSERTPVSPQGAAEELLRLDLALARKVASLDVITASCSAPESQLAAHLLHDTPTPDTPASSGPAGGDDPPFPAPHARRLAEPETPRREGYGALHVEVLRGAARSVTAFAPRLSPLLAGRVGSARKVTGFPPDIGPPAAPEAGASGQKGAANVAAIGSWGNRKLHEGLAAALAAACDREWRLDAKVPAPLRSAAWRRDEACPLSTGGGMRRVR